MDLNKTILISAASFEVESILKDFDCNQYFTYQSCGIGSLEAARNSLKLADLCDGRDVLFVGSAGVFGAFTEPYLVSVKQVWWLPLCERMGLSESIEGLEPPITLSTNSIHTLPQTTAICCPNIASTSEITPKWLDQLNTPKHMLVENLELYCVAKALQSRAKSFHVLLGITNAVCPGGRLQWRKNFRQVAELTFQWVLANKLLTN